MTGLRSRLPVHAPMTFVLLIAGAGMVRTLTQHWREGAVLLGGALIVAAVLRLLLPTDRVGLPALGGRRIVVLAYGGLGTVIAVLAKTITASLLNGG